MEHPIKIEPAEGGHHREAVRDSLFLVANVRRLSDGSERTVRVRNLSAGGMMADCNDDLARGEPVTTTLRGIGEISGRIAWRSVDKVGVTFNAQINPKLARKPIVAGESNVPAHVRVPIVKRPPIR